jgi:hypothetical protein
LKVENKASVEAKANVTKIKELEKIIKTHSKAVDSKAVDLEKAKKKADTDMKKAKSAADDAATKASKKLEKTIQAAARVDKDVEILKNEVKDTKMKSAALTKEVKDLQATFEDVEGKRQQLAIDLETASTKIVALKLKLANKKRRLAAASTVSISSNKRQKLRVDAHSPSPSLFEGQSIGINNGIIHGAGQQNERTTSPSCPSFFSPSVLPSTGKMIEAFLQQQYQQHQQQYQQQHQQQQPQPQQQPQQQQQQPQQQEQQQQHKHYLTNQQPMNTARMSSPSVFSFHGNR